MAAQNEFIEVAIANSRILSYCLNQYKRQWSSITACLPSSITAHSHYNKLLSSLKSKARKPQRQHKEQREHNPKSEDKYKDTNGNENRNKNKNVNSTLDKTDWVSSMDSKISTDKRKLKIECGTVKNKLIKTKELKPIPKKTLKTNLCKYGQSCLLSDSSTFLNTSDVPQYLMGLTNDIMCITNNSTSQSHSDNQDSDSAKAAAAALLWIKQLLGRNLPEHLVPLDDAFGKELRAWEECSGSLTGAGPGSLSYHKS